MVVVGNDSVVVEQPEGEPRQACINGELFPPFFKLEHVSSAKALEVYPDDIIVATFPKCGTTWVQHIVCQLTIDGYELKPGKELFTYTPLIEFVGGDVVRRLQRPRILKSHFNFNNLPKHDGAKVILVCRNPKDTLVSWFHHMRNIKGYNWENGHFDVFFDMFCEGRIPWGGYFDYHKGWLPYIHEPNVLVVKYEDMVADLEASVVRIAEFLGPNTANTVSDPVKLGQILQSSALESMKKDQQRWFPNVLRKPDNFIRKGVPGDWRNHLSVEQSEKIDRMFEKHFKNTVFADWWKDDMLWQEGMRDLNIQITVDGHPYPDGFMPENIRSARALKALPDDVFIVTYPKCGTTWVQHIVCQLMIEDYQLKPGKELFTWTPMIEFSGAAAALQRQRPRILKSHFFYRDCPKDPNAKYIFVTRNPKDAVVSAFHMTINQRREDYANISFDEFFDMFMEGKYSYGSYFDYHKEWLQHLQFHNALVVKYEDMIRDLKGAIVQIGEFLGGKAKEVIEDCAKLDKIVEDSTFSAMRKDQHRWIPNVLKGPDLFMRKGTPRDWKNYFTKKQSDQLDKEFAMHFKGIIAEHWWKEEMKWED